MPCLLHSGTQAWGKDSWWWLDGALPSSLGVPRLLGHVPLGLIQGNKTSEGRAVLLGQHLEQRLTESRLTSHEVMGCGAEEHVARKRWKQPRCHPAEGWESKPWTHQTAEHHQPYKGMQS